MVEGFSGLFKMDFLLLLGEGLIWMGSFERQSGFSLPPQIPLEGD